MSIPLDNRSDARDITVSGARAEQARPVRYMSPEALQANTWSEKSDVWAFGVMYVIHYLCPLKPSLTVSCLPLSYTCILAAIGPMTIYATIVYWATDSLILLYCQCVTPQVSRTLSSISKAVPNIIAAVVLRRW